MNWLSIITQPSEGFEKTAVILARNALQIARTEQQSVYDSLYLALAVLARCQLITADERLIKGIKSKYLKDHVISLRDSAIELDAS